MTATGLSKFSSIFEGLTELQLVDETLQNIDFEWSCDTFLRQVQSDSDSDYFLTTTQGHLFQIGIGSHTYIHIIIYYITHITYITYFPYVRRLSASRRYCQSSPSTSIVCLLIHPEVYWYFTLLTNSGTTNQLLGHFPQLLIFCCQITPPEFFSASWMFIFKC